MPNLTDISVMQLKEMASKTEKSIRILFNNIQKIMEDHGKDKVDKFVIDKAISLAHDMNNGPILNSMNYALSTSNKIMLDDLICHIKSKNVSMNSIIAQYYDNCHKADSVNMFAKEENIIIFKKYAKIIPEGIYDSIYRTNNVKIINTSLEPQSRQRSELDFEISNFIRIYKETD
jgi:hypothetical protein